MMLQSDCSHGPMGRSRRIAPIRRREDNRQKDVGARRTRHTSPQHAQTILSLCRTVILSALALSGPGTFAKNEEPKALSTTNRQDGIVVSLSLSPGQVTYGSDHVLDLAITHPDTMTVTLPDMAGRLEGFISAEVIDDDPQREAGQVRLRRRHLLTPIPARRHRIAPAPLVYRPVTGTAADEKWFPTTAIRVPTDDLSASSGATPSGEIRPRWIRPSLRTVGIGALVILGTALLAALLWKASARLRRRIRLMTLSPRDRALFELRELLAGDLLARQDFKEFYVRLTRIVRDFIERRHGIRAPEQTTEEFLAAISRDSRFPEPVAQRLRSFLSAADLVKFAAQTPSQDAITDIITTAREYIESDVPDPAEPRRTWRRR